MNAPLPTDEERFLEKTAQHLRNVYRVEQHFAEARVASLLIGGLPPRGIAHELEISFNTVRTHLQRIFIKTGASGQAELVRLLTRLGLTARARPHGAGTE